MSPFHHLRRFCSTSAGGSSATASSMSISKAKWKLRSNFDPDKALEIYSSVPKDSSPASSRYAQELTVRRLAKSKRFSDIETLIESHKNDPQITQEPFVCNLIRSYGLARMFDNAMRTFDQMDELGTPRSVLSFNALLSACIQSGRYHKVPTLFDEIPKKFNLSPDKKSYGFLLKSYCDSGSSDKALEFLNEMESKGLEVSNIAYTTVLNCLYKRGNVEEAERLWSEMVKKGVELDVAAYNVRITSIYGGDPEKQKELIDEMRNMGLKPDTISYNFLLTCYCKNGMMDEAKKVYDGLEENGCKPNATTFRTWIYYLCNGGYYERAHRVFKESVKMRKIPDFNTTKLLVEGLVKKQKISEAKSMIRTIKKKFPPNLLSGWKKIEEDLGLVSDSSVGSGDDGQSARVKD